MLPTSTLPPLPSRIAFDNSGDLWFIDNDNTYVGELTKAQLSASGSPTPGVKLTSASPFFGAGLAFNPHPVNVPLQ